MVVNGVQILVAVFGGKIGQTVIDFIVMMSSCIKGELCCMLDHEMIYN